MAGGGSLPKVFRHGTDCLRKHAYYEKKNRTLNEIEIYLLLYMYILFTAVGVLHRAQVSHRDVNAGRLVLPCLYYLEGVIGFPTCSDVSAEFTHRLFRNKLTFHFPCICRSPGATEVRIVAAS